MTILEIKETIEYYCREFGFEIPGIEIKQLSHSFEIPKLDLHASWSASSWSVQMGYEEEFGMTDKGIIGYIVGQVAMRHYRKKVEES